MQLPPPLQQIRPHEWKKRRMKLRQARLVRRVSGAQQVQQRGQQQTGVAWRRHVAAWAWARSCLCRLRKRRNDLRYYPHPHPHLHLVRWQRASGEQLHQPHPHPQQWR